MTFGRTKRKDDPNGSSKSLVPAGGNLSGRQEKGLVVAADAGPVPETESARLAALERAKAEKERQERERNSNRDGEKGTVEDTTSSDKVNSEVERAAAMKAAEKAAEKVSTEKAALDRAAAAAKAAEDNEAEAKAARQEEEMLVQLQKMNSTEAFGAQLSSKLTGDLSGLRKEVLECPTEPVCRAHRSSQPSVAEVSHFLPSTRQVEKKKASLETTEAEIKELERKSASSSEASAAAIASLSEECSSIKGILGCDSAQTPHKRATCLS